MRLTPLLVLAIQNLYEKRKQINIQWNPLKFETYRLDAHFNS